VVAEALTLARAGGSDAEISRATGIPSATVRNYRRRQPLRVLDLLNGLEICDRCGGRAHDFSQIDGTTYAYLLGVYLGDGCLVGTRDALSSGLRSTPPTRT
jgi:hypothetical protein